VSAEGVPVLIDRADVLKALRDTLNVTDNRVTQAFGKPWLDDAASRIMAIQPAAHPAATAREEAVVTCVYCGHAYPPGSPTHGAQLLKDHIAACEKHPMREVIAERDELGTLLAAIYRIDTTLTEESVVAAAALAERVEKALVAVDARALALAAKSGGK